ncbi:VanZ family protein [Halomicrobium mukohataei DSM 12286]|uniref:VanZ family protein n=1 Tax=Halomicrobium mukohataei (strain ATCC 700874 / DSM 12286 / JCM 9738 / NCIMB 13541) TaxID=485914 RepID=C7P378_HALMD|nr:VanZ family protein [Halomicrobium mukohataei DSM 12286]
MRWLIVGCVAAVILIVSVLRPGSASRITGPLGVFGIDKYLHVLAYGGLATVLAYALAEWEPRRAGVAVFVLAVAFGFVVELVQLPLAYRQFSRLDLLANAVGASVIAASWGVVAARLRFERITAEATGFPSDGDP